jgi:hypothetical protein
MFLAIWVCATAMLSLAATDLRLFLAAVAALDEPARRARPRLRARCD